LTQANAILGQGQMSLAKYLLIVAGEDDPSLDIHDIPAFFRHLLSRIDWRRDLHFQTRTTIDTLDYSGSGLNSGSKVVMAAAGPVIRELPKELPSELRLPEGWTDPRAAMPGVLVICGRRLPSPIDLSSVTAADPVNRFPLIVVVDDSEFTCRSLNNSLWVTFTRSNPAADISGVESFVEQKHWGCRGSLLIDARGKPHHAPPLVEDPAVSKKIDALAARGVPLSKFL
jgi:4-hydroxy-3-polyprenylbenzoate decarboxylase